MKRVLVPLPLNGSDPSEVAIPWQLLTEQGVEIVFITPNGEQAQVDQCMLTGNKLGIFKAMLAARKDAVHACRLMETSDEFIHPLPYHEVNADSFDAIYLPGGHDKTVRPYLESKILQQLIVDFFHAKKIVAAVCHGVVLVARSIDDVTGKSVLYDYQTTGLLKKQELLAFNLTRLWLDDYYLTYPEITVEDEVSQALKNSQQFKQGPLPLFRDSASSLSAGFVVCDRNYLSARWPGDIYNLANKMIEKLTK
jgi:protease I